MSYKLFTYDLFSSGDLFMICITIFIINDIFHLDYCPFLMLDFGKYTKNRGETSQILLDAFVGNILYYYLYIYCYTFDFSGSLHIAFTTEVHYYLHRD